MRIDLSRKINGEGLGVGAAALLIFLAGTAGARVVAANLSSAANDLLDLTVTGTCHACLLQFATLATLEGFLESVD